MSKPKGLDVSVRVIFLALLGFIALYFYPLAPAAIVIVVGWYFWKLSDKNRELEERLSALEGPSKKKPDKN